MEEKSNPGRLHKLTLTGRKNGSMSGIKDVLSFDAEEIVLDTEEGILTICGEDMHVSRLTVDKGEVEIEGKVERLSYSDQGKGKNEESMLRRFLR